MSSHPYSVYLDVKMQHLPNLETHQRVYYKTKCVGSNWVVMTMECEWAVLLGTEQLRLSVMRLAVTLLWLSHRTACSNTENC
jgi:DNA-binding NarL/FixJ family response regulator